jgi:hypothetical protein
MTMKRNLTLSIAAALMVAGAVAQAEVTSEATIMESRGVQGAGGGAYENPYWKDEYPFPRGFGRAVD